MTLDKEPVKISDAIRIAKKYYDDDTFNHAMRVAGYISENDTMPIAYKDECIALAIMHDLLEDTRYDGNGLPDNFKLALKSLTKPISISYECYCNRLRDTKNTSWKICAYWVKLADIKDHLNLTDTLTDKLKEKYLSGLRYLL